MGARQTSRCVGRFASPAPRETSSRIRNERLDAQVSHLLFQGHPRSAQPRPHGIDRQVLGSRDLITRLPLDREQQEGTSLLQTHRRKRTVDPVGNFSHFELDERVVEVHEQIVARGSAVSPKEPPVPGQVAVITNLAPCNTEQPPSRIASVEPAQSAARDQKDFLHQVVAVRRSGAKCSNPTNDMRPPVAVQLLEGDVWVPSR